MKKIFQQKDSGKGLTEVYLLKHNNRRMNDLIWLHWRDYWGKNESGIAMTRDEALLIANGLLKAVKVFDKKYKKQLRK